MPAAREESSPVARGRALRSRLLLLFLLPVLLVGAGAVIVAEILISGEAVAGGMPPTGVRFIYGTLFLVGVLLAAGLALYAAEQVRWPVAWLLRAMDTGELRPIGAAAASADWELGILVRRVQTLLQQNLSGAQAVEQLDALRDEVAAMLDAAAEGKLTARDWPASRASHPLTQRLLAFFQARDETTAEARGCLGKLQGLLEQDWREETRCVDEIVRRTEHCFLEQTQIAMELEQVERSLNGRPRNGESAGTGGNPANGAPNHSARPESVANGSGSSAGSPDAGASAVRPPNPVPAAPDKIELSAAVAEIRLGFDRWSNEVSRALATNAANAGSARDGALAPAGQTRAYQAWLQWVQESLCWLESACANSHASGNNAMRIAPRVHKLAELAGEASQGMHALSRETAQLQRTWVRLGERLRSYMARVDEIHEGSSAIAAEDVCGGENEDSQPDGI